MSDFNRCDTFWARQSTDRPLLSCLVGSYAMVKNYPHGVARIPDGFIQPNDIDLDAFRPDYEQLFVWQERAGVDVPWAAYPLISIPWVEAILGCPIYNSGGNMAAHAWATDYRQLIEMEIQPDNPWLTKLIEYQQFLVKLSNGRFPVANSLMRGPLDLLGAVRGSERMCLDVYDRPDELGAPLQHLTDLWIQVARAQMAVIPSFAGGYSFGQIDLWGRQQGGWFQDDAMALWSPKLYQRHIRACEVRLSQCMPATGIHLHPHSLFTIEHLVEMPALGVIEVNYEKPYGMPLDKMMPYLERAIEKKCLTIWGEFDADDLQMLADHLPTNGLSLHIIGESPENIQAIVREVERIWSARESRA